MRAIYFLLKSLALAALALGVGFPVGMLADRALLPKWCNTALAVPPAPSEHVARALANAKMPMPPQMVVPNDKRKAHRTVTTSGNELK